MKRYKIKKKLNILNSIVISLIVILFAISIGYSLWKDSQQIIGTIKPRYVEPKIENIGFYDENNDKEIDTTLVEDIDGIGTGTRVKFRGNKAIYTVDENTNKMEILVEFVISRAHFTWGRDVEISFKIKNNNSVPMTLGKSELLKQTIGYTPTLTMPETIGVGEDGTFTVSFHAKGPGKMDWGEYYYKIQYKIGEVTRYVYLTYDFINES